ncbi:hypothetical protein Desor_2176 [Desulfosporosinus orientis DSM 765]|uniref:Uncharacterized protein n=1 Tax=Desulfosporosinus orientis (strain ATCC 19365 / DSM 765 / NCIMB 8382 / VKM B-1628 / Singapore I) TaxID=768706 RepID=G7W8S0_DESOD|nr:hypothetical protein Desor_2176 [Desulfosporosinus orientis DSM 765]
MAASINPISSMPRNRGIFSLSILFEHSSVPMIGINGHVYDEYPGYAHDYAQ